MSTKSPVIHVRDLDVDVTRKDIKNLHIGVYPPFGRVRVAAPTGLDDDSIRLAVISRLAWISDKQKRIRAQARQTHREMVEGESHFVWGQKLRLRIVESNSRSRVELGTGGRLDLYIRPGTDRDGRERRLREWYRRELKDAIPRLIENWAPILGVRPTMWTVRRMKTKWGTCNPDAGRIWLNLELAKKPPECLEFIVVHEMVHLLERNHTPRFYELMNRFMPDWETRREVLNQAPLAAETWTSEAVRDAEGSRSGHLSERSAA